MPQRTSPAASRRSCGTLGSMEQNSPLRPYAKGALVAAACLLIPAVLWFCSAVISSITTGQVMVISIGKTETARQLVHWPLGWSRFASPFVLLGAIAVWALSKSSKLAWWVSACLAVLGSSMLVFSLWFVSWRGVVAFTSILAFICMALYVGNRFGRLAAIGFVLLAAVVVLVAAKAA